MRSVIKSGILSYNFQVSSFAFYHRDLCNMFRNIVLFTLIFVTIPFAMSQDFTDGLVFYHSYDEGDGDTAKDQSGNGHDGVIDKPNWVDGKFKKALQFEGAGSGTFVTIENTDTLNVDTCTFMAWVYSESWEGTRQIVGKSVHGGCTGRGQYGLFSEKGAFKLRFETETGRSDITTDLPAVDQWVHVTFTNDGTTGTIYIDGKEEATGNVPGKLKTNVDPLRISQDCDRPNNVFDGIIDEVRLWNRALSGNEIKSYMNKGADGVLAVNASEKFTTTWGNLKKAPYTY